MNKYERENTMNKYEEFVKYFEELDALGIAWSISDLVRKRDELKIEE